MSIIKAPKFYSDLLKDKKLYSKIKKYMENNRAEENLEFLEACLELSDIYVENPSNENDTIVQEKMEEIYNKFIKDNHINLNYKTKSAFIVEKLENNGLFKISSFKDAAKEIFFLVELDQYYKFPEKIAAKEIDGEVKKIIGQMRGSFSTYVDSVFKKSREVKNVSLETKMNYQTGEDRVTPNGNTNPILIMALKKIGFNNNLSKEKKEEHSSFSSGSPKSSNSQISLLLFSNEAIENSIKKISGKTSKKEK